MVYIRSLYTDAAVSTSLVIAKTKVAPLKTVTIPKLELCSAPLLSKLLSTVCKQLGIEPCKMFAWCDSTIVLAGIRSISRSCVTCQRTYAKTMNQIMAHLPASRVTPAALFCHVGIDLAGPIIVRRRHTRKPIFDKACIGVFVCLPTKAVHLELISDLSTAAFLAAFR